MTPLSFMRSDVYRNVVRRRIPVRKNTVLLALQHYVTISRAQNTSVKDQWKQVCGLHRSVYRSHRYDVWYFYLRINTRSVMANVRRCCSVRQI